jgi:hypothetical protein
LLLVLCSEVLFFWLWVSYPVCPPLFIFPSFNSVL